MKETKMNAWAGIAIHQDGTRKEIARNASLASLKSKIEQTPIDSGLVVSIPIVEERASVTFSEFAQAVLSANKGVINEIRLPKGIPGDMKYDPGTDESRCFLVIYSDGRESYECWQGTGIGGGWRACTLP